MNEEKPVSRLIDQSPSRKEIELEIPAAAVAAEFERILGDYGRRVRIAGFRKGHAPRDVVRNLFEHDIYHDVYDELIPRVVEEEIKSYNLHPVGVPHVRDLKHQPGEPLRCTVAVEVLPEFELPDYHDIRVPQRSAVVEDAALDKTLEDLRLRAAEYVPVEDRGVADGDYVVMELQGKDVKTKRLLPVEKAVVLAGHAGNDPAVNEHLPGLKPGEERRFLVSYPKDHPNRRVAGKEIEYVMKASEIKEKRVPALSDELAKTMGDYAGLDDLKAKVRRDMAEAKEKANRTAAAADVLKDIAKRLNLELPESLVEEEALRGLRRTLSAYPRQDLAPEAVEQLKSRARQQAVERITNHLLLEKIAAREGIRVGDEEIEQEIRDIARANNAPVASVMDAVNKEGRREEIRDALLFRKTVDFLVKKAIMS